jgi:hypothetical protein
VEDLEHRVILGQHHRLEADEAVGGGERGEPFEQGRPEAFALKPVGDCKGGFRGALAEIDVRADRNRPQLALDLPQRDQRRLPRRVGRIAERVDQRLGRSGEAEEAAPVRFRRQVVVEATQRVTVVRRRNAQQRDRAVAQDDARRCLVDRRRAHHLHG